MKLITSKDPQELGEQAALCVAEVLRSTLAQKETANLLVSTGASQFTGV